MWLTTASLRDIAATDTDITRPRAMPLAMLTMKKEALWFHHFYAWFCLFLQFLQVWGVAPRPFDPAKLRKN